MPYYRITNNTAVDYVSVSLSLAANATVLAEYPLPLPVDLDDPVRTETLTMVRIRTDGSSNESIVTEVTEIVVAAATVSQTLIEAQFSRLPPGVEIVNSTRGDASIRCSDTEPATWTGVNNKILAPGETMLIAADYLGAVKGICESTLGNLVVRVYT